LISSAAIANALTKEGITGFNVVISNNKNSAPSKPENLHGSERPGEVVSPGQLIRHYSPDIPSYIMRLGGESGPANLTSKTNLALKHAFIVDFNKSMEHLKPPRSAYYIDLSPTGSLEQACERLFRTLRVSESNHIAKDFGVRFVVLPDVLNSSQTACSVLGKNMEELTLALHERIVRAASALYICEKDLL